MNFQAFSVGEKLKTGGYTDTFGTPSTGLASEAAFIDASLGLMIKELKAQGIYDSTLFIVAAKHGQSPIDVTKKVAIANGPNTFLGNLEATDISDDGSLIWLNSSNDTVSAVQILSQNQDALGIQEIFAGKQIENKFDSPLTDERTPDIILKTNTGVIFTGGSKIAEHGGFNEDDYHVGLLFSLPGLDEKVVKTPVTNQQVAPSILKALGLDPKALQAVQAEGTNVLPFLF
jgi:arylsulfatase A-like enzyme